jgi:hypothetical protein
MEFLSLQPFVPSGKNFKASRDLFSALGFKINWEQDDYIGFQKDSCRFILQKMDLPPFAEQFMISVQVSNADEFWKEVNEQKIPEQYGVRISKPSDMPYGREVNMIDLAGVCWHFVQS